MTQLDTAQLDKAQSETTRLEEGAFAYRRILVATGGAPHSQKAVERAIALARQYRAVLHVVAVAKVTASPLASLAASFPGGGEVEAQSMQNAVAVGGEHLRQVARQADFQGVEVREHLVQAAKPAEAILAVALEVGADLIVLGRRHTSALSAAVAGSTGDAVSHAAKVDVLIAR